MINFAGFQTRFNIITMVYLAERTRQINESATLEMTRLSRELKSKGIDVINLSIGEPDFNTPAVVKEAAIEAIHKNKTHYTPVSGIPELRKAISEKLKRDNNLEYKPEQIVVSNGAKQSIANVMLALVDQGDEVLIPAPYWVSYPEITKLACGVPVEIPTSIENNFKITADQLKNAITPKTKVLIFSSPSNPTGMCYTREELRAIAELLANYERIYIISDEIYEYINFSGSHESIAQFDFIRDRVILINGVSKGYAMTGWRIGYLAAPPEIAKVCDTIQGQITSGASSVSQWASLKALQSEPCNSPEMKAMVETFHSRRDLVLKFLADIRGMKANIPDGAFYVFPDIRQYFGKSFNGTIISNSVDLCKYLLNEGHVALVPGSAFGNPDCIRISYATSEKELIEALNRIKNALSMLD